MITSANFLWKNLNLKNLFPRLQVLDEKVWETHIDMTTYELDAAGDFPQDKQMIKTLKNFASLQTEGESGITLLTLPKGLTFNKLVKLAQSPKQGNAAKFDYIFDRISEDLGDISVDKTYRVVITNNVLQGSRNRSIADQQDLVDILGCKMPEMLTVATLVILTHISSPAVPSLIRLYNDNPMTFTRCSELIAGRNLVVVGLAPAGFCINSFYFDHVAYTGVVVLQKF